MRVAIDKNCVDSVKNYDYEFIYLFNDETLKQLLKLNMHCIKYNECEPVDINLTDYNIECIKKTNIKEKNWDILPEQKDYKIAIIVPNFNYEHTIEFCLKSILNQTYKNYEIIFVDDMSTDKSVEIAKKLLKPPHKIIELKQKRLNGGARNEAYLHLSDDVDYIYYVDSDDWLNNETALERINKKLQTQPDVLFVGMEDYKNGKQRVCYIPKYKNKYEAFEGWSGSCGKVIKKELATRPECLYAEGTLKEDRTQHRKICIYMDTFNILAEPCYVWNQENTKSVTTIREIKSNF